MAVEQIKQRLLATLQLVAPEAVGEAIDTSRSLQDQLDIDSVDMLNYVNRIAKEFNLEIANKDYPQFTTIDGGVIYLQQHVR